MIPQGDATDALQALYLKDSQRANMFLAVSLSKRNALKEMRCNRQGQSLVDQMYRCMALCNAAHVTLSSLSCLRLFCVAVPCPRFLGLSFLPQFHDDQHQAHNTITLSAVTLHEAMLK